jgi:hypothetical protein
MLSNDGGIGHEIKAAVVIAAGMLSEIHHLQDELPP